MWFRDTDKFSRAGAREQEESEEDGCVSYLQQSFSGRLVSLLTLALVFLFGNILLKIFLQWEGG